LAGRSFPSDDRLYPSAGDLVWTEADPTRGREQAGRRPALVISAAAFTAYMDQVAVCPITSRVRSVPTGVVLPAGLPISGEILTSHVRSIDILARPIRYAGASAGQAVAGEVRVLVESFITI
jgi:mRNA interferase MazF